MYKCSSSRSPLKLYSQPPQPSATSKRPVTANLQFYSSVQALEITNALFRCQQSSAQNHTEGLKIIESEAVLRRGDTLILKITTSLELSGSYVVSLTFVSALKLKGQE